jgi:toxin ParE1/3/4
MVRESAAWTRKRILEAVRSRVEDILDAPERWAIAKGVRRALVTRFPYALVYREVAEGAVEFIAVAHLRRRPKYWSGR